MDHLLHLSKEMPKNKLFLNYGVKKGGLGVDKEVVWEGYDEDDEDDEDEDDEDKRGMSLRWIFRELYVSSRVRDLLWSFS
jgi:hypothetical protein